LIVIIMNRYPRTNRGGLFFTGGLFLIPGNESHRRFNTQKKALLKERPRRQIAEKVIQRFVSEHGKLSTREDMIDLFMYLERCRYPRIWSSRTAINEESYKKDDSLISLAVWPGAEIYIETFFKNEHFTSAWQRRVLEDEFFGADNVFTGKSKLHTTVHTVTYMPYATLPIKTDVTIVRFHPAKKSYFQTMFDSMRSIFSQCNDNVVTSIFEFLGIEMILSEVESSDTGRKSKRRREAIRSMRKRFKLGDKYRSRNGEGLSIRRAWSDELVYGLYETVQKRPGFVPPKEAYLCCKAGDLRGDNEQSFACDGERCNADKWDRRGYWWHAKCLELHHGFSKAQIHKLETTDAPFICSRCQPPMKTIRIFV